MNGAVALITIGLIFGYGFSAVESKVKDFADLEKYLQPDDVDSGKYDSMEPQNKYICTRTCKVGERPKICYYRFNVESYSSVGPACGNCATNISACDNPQCVATDGTIREVLVVNRRLSGPSIQVCKDDRIVVDVNNKMPGRSLTIHWHGILQIGTPYMDGTPMVTQCPIVENNIFRYEFTVPLAGTFFWHSHIGFQKMDAIEGHLIVRQPKINDLNANQYDYDLPSQAIIVVDWIHNPTDEGFPGLNQDNTNEHPDSYLINGRGRVPIFNINGVQFSKSSLQSLDTLLKDTCEQILSTDNGAFDEGFTPLSVFDVIKGYRYRFRIIAGTCASCPYRICVEGHRLTLVGLDASVVKPVTFDCIDMLGADRFDVVIYANQPVGTYWIKVQGLGGECNPAYDGLAILKYKGSKFSEPPTDSSTLCPTSRRLNPWNSPCLPGQTDVCVSQLHNLKPTPPEILETPAKKIVSSFNFYSYSNDQLFNTNTYKRFFEPVKGILLVGMMNNVSYKQTASPLLSQFKDIPKQELCSKECLTRQLSSEVEPCYCAQYIELPINETIEILLYDAFSTPSPNGLSHPFHIHGYDFTVLRQGIFDTNKNLEQNLAAVYTGLVLRNDFITKDTVAIPAGGYLLARIFTDNPGWWMLHCHFIFHSNDGMFFVFKIGDEKDFPPLPKNFPKCGNFLNKVKNIK